MKMKFHTTFLFPCVLVAGSLSAFAQQTVTPPATQQTTTTTTSTPTTDPTLPAAAPMTKKQTKQQRKQQKASEKAASESAQAQKDQANALKHQDAATDAQQKAQTPPQ